MKNHKALIDIKKQLRDRRKKAAGHHDQNIEGLLPIYRPRVDKKSRATFEHGKMLIGQRNEVVLD